jgi:CRISPR-associated protein Cas5d
MKVERVSYDVMTPSAARGILEAVHWKPAIRWVVDRIHVLKPIRFETLRRNEVGHKVSTANAARAMAKRSTGDFHLAVDEDRQQRASTVLRDVDYVIEAHFDLTDRARADDPPGKHLDMFNRRARQGQCFHQPCLGNREFVAAFELVEGETLALHPDLLGRRDLGWMLLDIDYPTGQSHFFRAELVDGIVEVPARDSPEVRS